MNKAFLMMMLAAAALGPYAQAARADDTWSNVPPASDDRYTNPKKALYAGPNGWFNFGEVRTTLGGVAKPKYQFKGGFNLIAQTFTAVAPSPGLQLMSLDFGTETPAVGAYEAGPTANPAQKKVKVEFSDVSENKIRNWGSATKGGVVTVSKVNNFLYMKFRGIVLQPNGISNAAESKAPITVSFEGAVKSD
ncbi:MAG TPA: hypothetical protein PLI90_09845 [Rhodocyclaceae bacterium]|nr:hypothetical protein [Rhodocyclaceae bacterium]